MKTKKTYKGEKKVLIYQASTKLAIVKPNGRSIDEIARAEMIKQRLLHSRSRQELAAIVKEFDETLVINTS